MTNYFLPFVINLLIHVTNLLSEILFLFKLITGQPSLNVKDIFLQFKNFFEKLVSLYQISGNFPKKDVETLKILNPCRIKLCTGIYFFKSAITPLPTQINVLS